MYSGTDIQYALENTKVIHSPDRRIESFGTTSFDFYLVTELMDKVDEIRVRAGRIQADRPKLLTPDNLAKLLLDGFGEKAERYIEQLREHVTEILDDLLSAVKPGEPFDVITTLAYPLPLIVICELMGVPVEDRDQFEGWSSDATRLLDGDIDEDTFNKGVIAAMYFLQKWWTNYR